jgi:MFS family permease
VHRLRRGASGLTTPTPGSSRARLVRDRSTWALYGLFAVWGWFLYSFNPSVPLIRAELGVSAAVAGFHGTALALGTVLAGLGQAATVARLGRRATIVAGGLLVAGSLLLITGVPALWATLSGAVLAGVGGTLLVNAANAALSDRHGPASGSAITEANGLGALVGALAPLTLGALVAAGMGWRPALLVVVPMVLVVLLVLPPLPSPSVPDTPQHPSGRLPGQYWWAWGVLVSLIAVEFSYSVWGTTLVAERTGTTAGTATGTLTVLILGLGIGRALGAPVALRVGAGYLLLGAIGLTAVGWVLLWTSTTLPQAIVGLGVSGLGMALHFPLGVARSLEASAGRPDLASGRIALGAGLAIGAAPFILGALTDAVGVVQAFLLVPVLLVLATVLLVSGRLSRGRQPA